ncbi:MAG: MG2 domain-containing protein, partial [Planctomycetaceae bacterium]|nr:MG2 domain-containing protein [Planctomycetaceae bacterium]
MIAALIGGIPLITPGNTGGIQLITPCNTVGIQLITPSNIVGIQLITPSNIVAGVAYAQVLRPQQRPASNRNTETPPDVPREINMQNPIPDCEKYMAAGLFKEAFDALQTWTLDPNADPQIVGKGFIMALTCLQNLNRVSEIDDYREQVVETHRKNWRLLMAVASTNQVGGYNYGNWGSIIDGKFIRGNSEGEIVYSVNRDRVQGMLLMQEAMPLALEDSNKSDVADFFASFAQMFRNRNEAWKMQALTDLSGTLPDYESMQYGTRMGGGNYNGGNYNIVDQYGGSFGGGMGGYGGGGYGGGSNYDTPVDEANNPVYYDLPKSFESAKSDGERWRWCLAMMVENNPKRATEELFERADFCNSQFGVGRLAGESRYNSRINEREAYSVKTLADNETATKLATGIRRFALPDEQNPIVMLKRIIAIGDPAESNQIRPATQSEKNRAVEALAVIAEERMQYVKAANYYEQLLKDPLNRNEKDALTNWTFQLNKITGAWGAFDPAESKVAGIGANLSFNFRNAKKVRLTATEIKVPQLLFDVKAYLRANPSNFGDSVSTDLQQIGWKLVNNEMVKYLGAKVADWDIELTPDPEHADKRVTITTPMTKAGVYFVKAETLDPATGRVASTDNIIVWLNDTAIVTKNLDNQTWIYVADAITGTPVPNATVNVFGYRTEGNPRRVIVTEKSLTTNAEGQATYVVPDQQWYQYTLTATTKDGRFAHCGFSEIWFQRNSRYDEVYNEQKEFFMSDRPVYRPGDTTHYKFWVGTAKYDQPFTSPFANQKVLFYICSPRGDIVDKKVATLDAYGGFEGHIELPKDAELGIWRLVLLETTWDGDDLDDINEIRDYKEDLEYYTPFGTFRVEEYKKPEFEVTVDAPREPVMLGDTISAKITAKYYFGAPVTNATVKYKVLREPNNSRWYPVMPWD